MTSEISRVGHPESVASGARQAEWRVVLVRYPASGVDGPAPHES
jgi:hypothetical protein